MNARMLRRQVRKSRLRNHPARQNARGGTGAAHEAIWLVLIYRVTQFLRELLCPIRADDAVRCSGVAGATGAVGSQGSRIESAAAFGSRRNRNETGFRPLHLPRALIVREPEQLVLDDRAAGRVTELIAAEFRLGRREVVFCVELIVAQEFERIAVETVGAGLRDGVDDRAAELAVFGVEAVGDQAEFSSIESRLGTKPAPRLRPFTNVAAVYQESVGGVALAVDRDVAGVREKARDRTILLNRRCRAGGHAFCLQAEEGQ